VEPRLRGFELMTSGK